MSAEMEAPKNSAGGNRVVAYVLTIPLMLVVWLFFLLPMLSQATISLTLLFGAEPKHIGVSVFVVAVGYSIAGVFGAILSFWGLRLAGRGKSLMAPLMQVLALSIAVGIALLTKLFMPEFAH